MKNTTSYHQVFNGYFLQKLLVMLDRIDTMLAGLANDARLQDIRRVYTVALHDLRGKRRQLETELGRLVEEAMEQADHMLHREYHSIFGAGPSGLLPSDDIQQLGLDEFDLDGGYSGQERVADLTPLPGDDEFVGYVCDMKKGTWLLFREEGMPPYRACFAWCNRVTNIYYFINQHGHLMLEKTLDELAEDLRSQSAIVVRQEPLGNTG